LKNLIPSRVNILLSICVFIFSINIGQAQETIKIGKQIWTTTNLVVITFRNGDPIPIVTSEENWKKAGHDKKPAMCYYMNNELYGITKGVLY